MKLTRLDRWVRTGFQYLKLNLCRRVSLPESECKKLSHLHLSGVAVYVSESLSAGKVLAILPDSYFTGTVPSKSADSSVDDESRTNEELYPGASAHDAVLVLDPSPGESFGHPVVLFYVNFNITKKKCAHMDGIYLGECAESDSSFMKKPDATEVISTLLVLNNAVENALQCPTFVKKSVYI